jgi:hypothetical protein
VNFLGKMLGSEEIRDPVEGIVIDEDRAKQRLFRLDVMRRQSECGLWAGAGPKASSFGKRFDGWHKVSRPAPTCAAYAESVQDAFFLWHAGAAKRREFSHLLRRLPLSTWAENFAKKWLDKAPSWAGNAAPREPVSNASPSRLWQNFESGPRRFDCPVSRAKMVGVGQWPSSIDPQ